MYEFADIAATNIHTQYHVINTEQIKQLAEAAKLSLLEYDGYGEFWFEGIEQLAALAEGETYHKVMVPDEFKFTKRNDWKIMVGEVVEKFCAGERPA